MTLHLYKDQTAKLDLQVIIHCFVGNNRRRAEQMLIQNKIHILVPSIISYFDSASASFGDKIALNLLAAGACRSIVAAPRFFSKLRPPPLGIIFVAGFRPISQGTAHPQATCVTEVASLWAP